MYPDCSSASNQQYPRAVGITAGVLYPVHPLLLALWVSTHSFHMPRNHLGVAMLVSSEGFWDCCSCPSPYFLLSLIDTVSLCSSWSVLSHADWEIGIQCMNGTTRLTLSMGFLPILLSGSDIKVERWDVHKPEGDYILECSHDGLKSSRHGWKMCYSMFILLNYECLM